MNGEAPAAGVVSSMTSSGRDQSTHGRCVVKPVFSHREKQILSLVVSGLGNKEIADRVFLAESTVKSHLASAFAKLGVRSRKDAVSVLLDRDEGLAATALPRAADRAPTSAS